MAVFTFLYYLLSSTLYAGDLERIKKILSCILHFLNILNWQTQDIYNLFIQAIMFFLTHFLPCAVLAVALPVYCSEKNGGAFPATGTGTLTYTDRTRDTWMLTGRAKYC